MAWSMSLSVAPASLRASANASRASGTYISSPKRSSQTWESVSPGTRQRSRNSSLAEPRPTSSATAPSAPQRKAAAPSPDSRSSAPPASPVRRSAAMASVRRGRAPPAVPSSNVPEGRARCAGEVVGARRPGRVRGRHARWWRWSCRDTPAPAWRRAGRPGVAGPRANARRPASTPRVVVSSS